MLKSFLLSPLPVTFNASRSNHFKTRLHPLRTLSGTGAGWSEPARHRYWLADSHREIDRTGTGRHHRPQRPESTWVPAVQQNASSAPVTPPKDRAQRGGKLKQGTPRTVNGFSALVSLPHMNRNVNIDLGLFPRRGNRRCESRPILSPVALNQQADVILPRRDICFNAM